MSNHPLLSFIVLSYNYESCVGMALRSILDQTVQDFEVIVIDDSSTDRSCDVIRSFGDPRIHLHVNERNMGGAWSYNRAVTLARGEFLVNLDADDWIKPEKSEVQLAAFEREPELDILGTHVSLVDMQGNKHALADEWAVNGDHDFNRVDTWVAQNLLCRSTTMMRRNAHERIGLDDPMMVRAPDYELWTRAFRKGCRFGLLPRPLTFYRLHRDGVTYGDPNAAFSEVCHIFQKNLVPLIEERNLYSSFARVISWIVAHQQFTQMSVRERERLLGLIMISPGFEDYAEFTRALADTSDRAGEIIKIGRRCLVLSRTGPGDERAEKLENDVVAYIEARDYYKQQAENWRNQYEYSKTQIEIWKRRHDDLTSRILMTKFWKN